MLSTIIGAAIALLFQTSASASETIQWTPCGLASHYQVECGSLSVPLDYANPSLGMASLSIMKLPAIGKRKGSLFTNPGGPGLGGTGEWLRMRAPDMLEQSGGEYDIVSWDIRGVNGTTPNVTCFESEEAAQEFWKDSLWFRGVETNSSLQSSADRTDFYSHVETEDTRLKEYWKLCNANHAGILEYIGTAADARDVASLANAMDGEGSEINYWGFSYGSVLGQYIIALFPDRLGRMIIDGVVYAPKWSVERSLKLYSALLTDSDNTYHGFAKLCAEAGPSHCALASEGSTQQSILKDIDDLLLATYDPTHKGIGEGLSLSSTLKNELFLSLQQPRGRWQPLATYLRSQIDLVKAMNTSNKDFSSQTLVAKNARKEFMKAMHHGHESDRLFDAKSMARYWAITCSDAPDHDGTTTLDVFDEVVATRRKSELFGPMWPTEGGWPCHQWNARAVERVTEFKVKPKHPVLILSNMNDPITPLENGRQALENSFEKGDAGLGVRDGYGHCSYTMKSKCLTGIIQAYMHDWSLPVDNMTPCPTDEDLFPDSIEPWTFLRMMISLTERLEWSLFNVLTVIY